MAIRVTISFPDKEAKLLDHLRAQPNQSEYIRTLIKQDMTGTRSLENVIFELIQKHMSQKDIAVKEKDKAFLEEILSM